jgi:hypothetical protein
VAQRSAGINLALILKRGSTGIEDLTKISGYLRAEHDDIHPVILRDRRHPLRRVLLARRPTLIFSPAPFRHFRPLRGTVVQGRGQPKSWQCRALERCGLPLPRWVLESRASAQELERFGAYVVVKPNRGSRGAEVRIKRRSRLQPARGAVDESSDRILQEFVYTGRWPVSYRVTTLFGEVVWSLRIEAGRGRAPLEGPEGFRNARQGVSIVSSGRGCTMHLNDERDVIELGERAHAAFPDSPVLGVDIVRDAASRRLYILEVNPTGRVWTFSTKTGKALQAQFGFRLEEQFDGLRKAAGILAREARRRAR